MPQLFTEQDIYDSVQAIAVKFGVTEPLQFSSLVSAIFETNKSSQSVQKQIITDMLIMYENKDVVAAQIDLQRLL